MIHLTMLCKRFQSFKVSLIRNGQCTLSVCMIRKPLDRSGGSWYGQYIPEARIDGEPVHVGSPVSLGEL